VARVNQDLSDNEAAWSECLRRLPLAQDYVQSAVLGKALLALPSRLRSNRRAWPWCRRTARTHDGSLEAL